MPSKRFSTVDRLHKAFRRKANRRRLIRYSLLAANIAVLAAVIGFVFTGSHDNNTKLSSAVNDSTGQSSLASPLDKSTSYNIAASVANVTHLPEAPLVNGQVVSQAVQAKYASVGVSLTASKPQIVQTKLTSRDDIKNYTAVVGDTVSGIAVKFGVSSDSIRWSNNMTGEAVNAGTKLVIPPVTGIVYTVKAGDTPETLAQTYGADRDLIVASNDAEIKGLYLGEQIIIPGGKKAVATYSGLSGSNYSYSYGNVAGNYSLYDRNNCTWWVALRWAQTGRPIMPLLGNASQWYYVAKNLGMAVGTTPQVHAAAVTSTRGFGHVVFVENVNDDGSIDISEMNVDGRASSQVWRSTVPASTAAGYLYVY